MDSNEVHSDVSSDDESFERIEFIPDDELSSSLNKKVEPSEPVLSEALKEKDGAGVEEKKEDVALEEVIAEDSSSDGDHSIDQPFSLDHSNFALPVVDESEETAEAKKEEKAVPIGLLTAAKDWMNGIYDKMDDDLEEDVTQDEDSSEDEEDEDEEEEEEEDETPGLTWKTYSFRQLGFDVFLIFAVIILVKLLCPYFNSGPTKTPAYEPTSDLIYFARHHFFHELRNGNLEKTNEEGVYRSKNGIPYWPWRLHRKEDTEMGLLSTRAIEEGKARRKIGDEKKAAEKTHIQAIEEENVKMKERIEALNLREQQLQSEVAKAFEAERTTSNRRIEALEHREQQLQKEMKNKDHSIEQCQMKYTRASQAMGELMVLKESYRKEFGQEQIALKQCQALNKLRIEQLDRDVKALEKDKEEVTRMKKELNELKKENGKLKEEAKKTEAVIKEKESLQEQLEVATNTMKNKSKIEKLKEDFAQVKNASEKILITFGEDVKSTLKKILKINVDVLIEEYGLKINETEKSREAMKNQNNAELIVLTKNEWDKKIEMDYEQIEEKLRIKKQTERSTSAMIDYILILTGIVVIFVRVIYRPPKNETSTRSVTLKKKEDGYGMKMKGAMIKEVIPGGAAEAAKLQAGHEIIAVGRVNVETKSFTEIYDLIRKSGQSVKLWVRENKDRL